MKHKHDQNHAAVVAEAKKMGASVKDTSSLGGGFPDACVGWFGNNYLIEIKTATGKLKNNQEIFHRMWAGKIHVVRSREEIRDLLLNNVTRVK
jgi:hypothetical protein